MTTGASTLSAGQAIEALTGAAPRARATVSASIFASAALAASGAWSRSSIVDVAAARKLTLLLDYDPAAVAGAPHLILLGACTADAPAAGDDSWFMLTATDGSITAAVSTGTVPTGADYTVVQVMGTATLQQMIYKLAAATNAADEIRAAVTIDVTPFRWFHFIAAEVGVTGTPGTLVGSYVLSA